MSQPIITPEIRALVAQQSAYQCRYCLSQEDISGTRFTVDHIIPKSLGGETVLGNLCLACWDCNMYKQNRIVAVDPETESEERLFHPNQENWEDHFQWEMNGLFIVGKTSIGRATIALLRLNRPLLLRARERWIKAGWHPPSLSSH